MEIGELRALLTAEGMALLDGIRPVENTTDAAQTVSRLRSAGHPPDLVAAVVTQARLRERGRAKFGEFAERMLFTRAGLEQATRRAVGAHHAARMRGAGVQHVADLGCGIGGDALAFAALGMRVTAVDADEVTAAIASYNLAVFGDQVEVRHETAQEFVEVAFSGPSLPTPPSEARGPDSGTEIDRSRSLSLSKGPANTTPDALWLDPARRTGGHSETRRIRPEDYSPPLDWVFNLASRYPTGIKLGPAHDRDQLPESAETQWISADGSVVELVVWTGGLERDGIRRSALVLRGEQAHELTAASDTEDEPAREIGAFLHEPDGAVIRARLIGDLARSLDAGMLDPQIAYLTGDREVTTPFAQTFRVREVMPAKVPTINASLRSNDIGTLEIKKRGMDVDPAQFRRKLVLRGRESATLILARVGSRRLAILADRV